jgi:chorismate--pyruvate lyase
LTENISFPLGIDALWHSPQGCSIPDPYLKNWLLDTGSLTERLQSHCRDFRVQLIGQRPLAAEHEEFLHMDVPQQQRNSTDWQVREVILWGENRPWVFARSIIPDALCNGDLANLGSRPLGKVIFNDPRFVRLPFQVGRLLKPDSLLRHLEIPPVTELWGRRSVFHFEQLKMMVAEIFLPDAPAYRQGAGALC